MAILIILIVLAVLVGLYFLNTQRELVNLDEMANNALSQIGVQLQQTQYRLHSQRRMVLMHLSHTA